MTIKERLKHIEDNLSIYNKYMNDTSNSEDNRKLVSFKALYEMMAFTALKEFAPDYKAEGTTEFTVAASLRNINDLVSVVDGKVLISPEYKMLLQQKEEYLKNKN
jgi:hypothetical protein